MEGITGKRILLIGGAGFIGHHLALSLSQQGAQVWVIDGLEVNSLLGLLSTPASKKPNRDLYISFVNQRLDMLRSAQIPLIVQDARDYVALSKHIGEIKPDVVVHLAAVAHANISNKDPYSTFDHSLRTLENALDACRKRVEHFIYFSSSMVYGNFKHGVVSEDTVCDPLGIYGSLKFAGEKMVIAYNQVFDMPYTIIRPSALYGEGCISRRVAQIFVENAVMGLEVSLDGDGSDRLDFTYIKDLAHGVECAISRKEARNEIFNITYGDSRSLAQMAEILRQQIPGVQFQYKQRDKLTPARGTLSIEKARSMIGYQPSFPLEVGYPNYIKWYQAICAKEPSLQLFELNV